MNNKIQYVRLIFILCIIVILIFYAPQIATFSLKDILEFTPKSPALAALTLVGIYCLKSVMMVIPLVLLYIIAGIIFPPGWAITITYFCLILEMTLSFFIGRYLGSDRVLALINRSDRARKIMELGSNNGVLSCFIIRFIPGPPFDFTNMLIGTTDVKFSQFMVGTLLGITPGMIPLVMMGEAAANPLSPKFIIPFAASLLITCSVVIGYHFWRKKLKMQTNI